MADSNDFQVAPNPPSNTWVPSEHENDRLSASSLEDRLALTKVNDRIDAGNHGASVTIDGRANTRERIGDFTIVRKLGQGGMGVVYEAQQESLQRTVALKVLPLAGRLDQREIQRFQNESRAAAQLHHPNIVPVYSVGTDAGVHYYAMQLIAGHDLAHFIRHAKSMVESKVVRRSGETPRATEGTTVELPGRQKGELKSPSGSQGRSASAASFPSAAFIEMMTDRSSVVASRGVFGSVVQIGIDAADALHHAHLLGIVHRDIKPSNLLLDEQGKVWITDFGLAQVQGAAALTMTGEVIGTLRYMSPEQPLGQRVLVDQRTDIYSLGVTLYELLTLTKAYGGETPKEIIRQVCFDDPRSIRRLNPHVPEDLETIVLKAMSKNPDERYQTAKELADDLRRFDRDEPILARRPTAMQRCRRWVRRHTAVATAIAVATVVLCVTSVAASAITLSAWSAEVKERKRAESLLEKSEGLRLTANSSLEADNNPGLSLLLAIKGAELNPGVDANSALLNALSRNHEERTFSPRPEISTSLTISPDGQRVVTTVERSYFGKGSFPAIESDLRTGETLRTFDDGTAVTSAAYSPDGKFLLTTAAPFQTTVPSAGPTNSEAKEAALAGVPVIWNAGTGIRIVALNDAVVNEIRGTEFSPSSERVVLPGRDNTVNIYSTTSGRLDSSLKGHSNKVLSAAFSADGDRVVSVGSDKTVRVWDVKSAMELRQFPIEVVSENRVPTACFLGDSERLVISSAAGTRVVSVTTGEQLNPKHWDESASSVTRDGRYVALYLRFGKHVAVWDTRSFRLRTEFDLDDYMTAVEFSDDSRRILVITSSSATIHRTDDGAVLATLEGHTEMLTDGRISSNGQRVVTTANDGTIRSWHVRNGEERLTISDRPAKIAPSPWAFSDDSALMTMAVEPAFHAGLRAATGMLASPDFSGRISNRWASSNRMVTYEDHEVVLWHVPSSRRIAEFSYEAGIVRDALSVPGTSVVVVLVDRDSAILWNTESDVRIRVGGAESKVQHVDVHPSNGTVAIAQWNGDCLIVDAASGEVLRTLPHENGVLSVSFSDTGSRMLTVDTANTARLWLAEKDEPAQTLTVVNSHLNRARFSADETVVVTWSALQTDCVRAWRTETGELIAKTREHSVQNITVHDSQPIVAIASTEDGLMLWNWSSDEERQLTTESAKTPIFLKDQLMSVESVPGFQVIKSMIPGYGGRPEFGKSALVIRDVNTTQIVSSQALTVEPWNLSLDKDTGNAVLSFRTHDVELIRMEDHQSQAVVGHHGAPIVFQGISNSLKRVVCASMDGTVSTWDFSGRSMHLLADHKHPIVNAALSSDGMRLATFDATGVGHLWNLEDGKRIMELPGHSGIVHVVQFSASGKRLLTAGSDSGIHLWDLISQTKTDLSLEPGILSAEWSPDESRLLIVTGEVQNTFQGDRRLDKQAIPSEAFLLSSDGQSKVLIQSAGVPQFARFRPGGKQVVVLSSDGNATLCDLAGQAVSKFNPNRQPIKDFAFSPDGVDLLVMHDDEFSLWDLDHADEILRIPNIDRSRSRIGHLKLQINSEWRPFSPDGNWILTDKTQLEKWPRNLQEAALKQVPRPMTREEILRFSVGLMSEPLR